MPNLVPIEINDAGSDEYANAPIEAKDRLDVLKRRWVFYRNLDNEIENRVAWAIGLDNLPQTGSQRTPGFGAFDDQIGQPHLDRLLPPGARPLSLFVRSSQGQGHGFLIQIVAHAVGLAHCR